MQSLLGKFHLISPFRLVCSSKYIDEYIWTFFFAGFAANKGAKCVHRLSIGQSLFLKHSIFIVQILTGK